VWRMLTIRNIAPIDEPTPEMLVLALLAPASGKVEMYGAMIYYVEVSEGPATQGG
jgi:hypothetical protein